MRRKNCFFAFVFLFLSFGAHAQDAGSALLDEYKLLYTDLLNIQTWGYKSFYDKELNKAGNAISPSQGAIHITDRNLNFAIIGEGFFKIRLADNMVGYTRSGDFRIGEDGALLTPQGYALFDAIDLGTAFLPESFRITQDHSVYIKSFGTTSAETETKLGQLLTYKISDELLRHYEDSIYIIKDGAEYTEEITFNNRIVQGALESSNYDLVAVAIRMYYILSLLDENLMPNVGFKQDSLRMQIERFSRDNFTFDKAMFSLGNGVDAVVTILEGNNLLHGSGGRLFTSPGLKKTPRLNTLGDTIQAYLADRLYFLESVLPFIKYDY
ncbi:MAG: hypothetical protein LBT33_06495 [Spirochaetia bacterium]|jgi:flagellar basal body rod protein FlgF|nr:hypothetical protein [Spirochaetia bacterium]